MKSPNKTVELLAGGYESGDFKAFIELKRAEMIDYIPKDASKILDIGCATGSFGEQLKAERKVEVWGVEINEYAASIASKKLDKVICGSFNNLLDLPLNSFDCVVFNDVLEHMVDPYSALIYCKSLLKEGGKVVASIPNVRYFDNVWKYLVHKDWTYTEYGILDRTHLRFFTYKSILSTFDNLDYKVEVLEGINPLEKEHPYHKRKFKFLNFVFFNQIADMRYQQFAVVAIPENIS